MSTDDRPEPTVPLALPLPDLSTRLGEEDLQELQFIYPQMEQAIRDFQQAQETITRTTRVQDAYNALLSRLRRQYHFTGEDSVSTADGRITRKLTPQQAPRNRAERRRASK